MRCTEGSAVPSSLSPSNCAPVSSLRSSWLILLTARPSSASAASGATGPPAPLHCRQGNLGLSDLVRTVGGAMIRPASSGASAKAVMLVASRRTGRTIRIWSVMNTSPPPPPR